MRIIASSAGGRMAPVAILPVMYPDLPNSAVIVKTGALFFSRGVVRPPEYLLR
jgi:hypothetical protein